VGALAGRALVCLRGWRRASRPRSAPQRASGPHGLGSPAGGLRDPSGAGLARAGS
jgi:hypothetical protein